MSRRSRLFKADQRRHIRYAALRDRIRANQAEQADALNVAMMLYGEAFIVVPCSDPERLARRWNESHPDPLPGGIGHAYHRRRR